MSKKFELTPEKKIFFEKELFRIKALKDFSNVKVGDFGGWIEKEENLSQEGNCWVYDDASVYDNAKVYGNAMVCENAMVSENAKVSRDAMVYGYAKACGNAMVSGDARVSRDAMVYGYAWVYGDAEVYGKAKVYGNACVCGNAKVYGDAKICSNASYLCFGGLGSHNRNTTFFKCEDGHIHVSCGCFSGNLAEFKTEIEKTHGETKFAKEYLICIEVVKIHFELENINEKI